MKETDIMIGLAKGLLVIEAFGAGRSKLTITDVSVATGLDRATARRCLLTLVHLGYAHHDGKFFTLLPRVLRLGYSFLSSLSLANLVQPYLDRLLEIVQETVAISILDREDIVYIARAARKRVMSVNVNPGSRLPAHCTAMGRILLAAIPPAEARTILESSTIKQMTPNTLTDIDAIMEEVGKAREQGYALSYEELEMGVFGFAIPIRGSSQRIIAAMNVGGSSYEIINENKARHHSREELVDRYIGPMKAIRQQIELSL